MKIRSSIVLTCVVALGAVLVVIGSSAGALAQQPKAAPQQKAPPAAKEAPPAESQGQQAVAIPTPWIKICSTDPEAKKEICLTSQDIRAETGQFLASVAVREVQDDPKKQFIVAVPPGMQLQPGLRVVVDQTPPTPAKYSICFPNACYGDMDINVEFIGRMKKGQALTVQAINQVGRTVNFTLPLKDFAKSYDGPPVDPKVLAEQRDKMQEGLQKKAKELLDSQKK